MWARISPSMNRWVRSDGLVRKLSGGLAYSVIDSDVIPGVKLGLDVRLSRKAIEKELSRQPLARQAKSPGKQIIGVWFDRTPVMASRITLYKKGGRIFWEYDFKDSGKLTREVIERSSSSGRRFDMRNRNSSGDYLVIKRSGVLEIRDSYGLVTTAQPVK